MVQSDNTSINIFLKENIDIEKEGRILQIKDGASIETIRSLAAEKLHILCPSTNIILQDKDGNTLKEIDQICKQSVIYVDLKETIKTVIPGPTKLPYVGNLYDMLPDQAANFIRCFKTYGPLVDITILGIKTISTCDPNIAELFVKESEYFTKTALDRLIEFKPFAGQGLFTTGTTDPDWKIAHKLLIPAFSPRAIKVYQTEMGKIAKETIKVLEQYSSDEKVEILHWTTNLTFETIGRIGFGYKFNLLNDRDVPAHPFIDAMGYCLKTAVQRFTQVSFVKRLPLEKNRRFDRSVKLMHTIVDEVIQERKKSDDATNIEKDLLGFMLNARDEEDEGLTDENIRDQVVTFLIAGHDTTANTLAWLIYELSQHPDIEAKVLQEISNVGINHTDLPTTEQVSQLKYLHMCLKETLRLHPPVRTLGKYCKKDCVVPGGYLIKKGTNVAVQLNVLHTNPEVYLDPWRFDPSRWEPEEEQKRSRFSWMPFSTGARGCIGMAFALQEAKTVLAMFLHRFKFTYDGPPVTYDANKSLTKPVDFFVSIETRTDFPEPTEVVKALEPKISITSPKAVPELPKDIKMGDVDLPPVTFLYGSQTGISQDYASTLSNQARKFGFKNVKLTTMDKWEVLNSGTYEGPKDSKNGHELVVICTSTYNGLPPDNAEIFNKFIEKANESGNEKLLDGLQYTVFGVGNKNWRTYQHFPIKVDNLLDDLGAERFFSLGECNVDGDMDADFNEWSAHFWSELLSYHGLSASQESSVVPSAGTKSDSSLSATVTFISPDDSEKWNTALTNCNGDHNSMVVKNSELQNEGSGRSTRDIRIDISYLDPLETGSMYQPGDHLEILPENESNAVETIALGFGMVLDSVFDIDQEKLDGMSPRSLAATIKGPCTVLNALTYYADLLSPPSRRMLGCFSQQLQKVSPETAKTFEELVMPDSHGKDQYPEFIKKYRTLIDLQTGFPQVKQIELGQFLAAVGVMQPRRYSIASSPRMFPNEAHLAVGVVDDVVDGHHYPGLASSFLARQVAGLSEKASFRARLKSSKGIFEMPQDSKTPIIMISAGTGISPFRGFIQERAYQRQQGDNSVGECVVFFGCRHPDQDRIYGEEFDQYAKEGVISSLNVAYSRQTPTSARKYVQHQVLANASKIWPLIMPKDGKPPAVVYICGSGAMSRDVRATFHSMAISFGQAQNQEEAQDFLKSLMDSKQYCEDVWG
ncbi:cytochrome P450 [Spinellus fusiger]|nr:cytochrome P450 [Spinellus fusiger]